MLHRHERALRTAVDTYTHDLPERTPIHPEYVAAVLDELAADDAVFTVDTGLCNVWAARYLTPNGRRRVIGSFRHGSIANALPHAIGAQAADRGRQVVSISGDGGLSMLRGELLTARQHNGPYLVDVVTDPDALSLPPHITAAEVRGCALASSKIVLEGGVGTMIELARANLRNIRAL